MTRKIGDIFEIPLADGRKAYAQYVFHDKKMGPLVQIFDLIKKDTGTELAEFNTAKPLFPPIITGLHAAVRLGMWKVIGNLPVNNFTYPKFISTLYDQSGKATIWYLWDGEKSSRIGPNVPDEYIHLEFLCVWSPEGVVERIETGTNLYTHLIKTNSLKLD